MLHRSWLQYSSIRSSFWHRSCPPQSFRSGPYLLMLSSCPTLFRRIGYNTTNADGSVGINPLNKNCNYKCNSLILNINQQDFCFHIRDIMPIRVMSQFIHLRFSVPTNSFRRGCARRKTSIVSPNLRNLRHRGNNQNDFLKRPRVRRFNNIGT